MLDVLDVPNDEVLEVVPIDDVVAGLREVAAGDDAQVSAGLADVSEKLDSLSSDVRALADSGNAGDDVTYTVMLTDEQWQTARDCWVWAKSGFSVALFLLLLSVLLVASVLGSRLWDTFSAGWRHG